jgi:hypothetical protein
VAQGTTNCANRTHWSQPRNAHQRPSRARSGALPGRESGGVEIDLGPCPAAEFGIAKTIDLFAIGRGIAVRAIGREPTQADGVSIWVALRSGDTTRAV